MRISSPVARGSGACVVHDLLAQNLPEYTLAAFNPWLTLFPPLLRRCADRRAQLVHAPLDYGAWCAVPGKPLVATAHGFALDAAARRHASPLQALHYATDLRWHTLASLRRATVVTAVSHHLAGRLRDVLGHTGPVRVIHNGVDVRRFAPRVAGPGASRRLRVLYVGGAARHKGADLVPAIRDRLEPGIEIAWAAGARGTGGAVPAGIVPLGGVRHGDMPTLYREADLLLAPSRREGFGMAIAEAMACGLPVVASDCSAIPELVVHGRGGWLCPVDDVEAFAAAVNRLAAEPALRRDMGAFNRARVEAQFTLERMLQAYRGVFEEALAAPR